MRLWWQNDLRLLFRKHKKELSELKEQTKAGAYQQRLAELARENQALRAQSADAEAAAAAVASAAQHAQQHQEELQVRLRKLDECTYSAAAHADVGAAGTGCGAGCPPAGTESSPRHCACCCTACRQCSEHGCGAGKLLDGRRCSFAACEGAHQWPPQTGTLEAKCTALQEQVTAAQRAVQSASSRALQLSEDLQAAVQEREAMEVAATLQSVISAVCDGVGWETRYRPEVANVHAAPEAERVAQQLRERLADMLKEKVRSRQHQQARLSAH